MKHREWRMRHFKYKDDAQNPMDTSTNVNKAHILELKELTYAKVDQTFEQLLELKEPTYAKVDQTFKDITKLGIGYSCLY